MPASDISAHASSNSSYFVFLDETGSDTPSEINSGKLSFLLILPSHFGARINGNGVKGARFLPYRKCREGSPVIATSRNGNENVTGAVISRIFVNLERV
jgi:hypothetical protein